MGVAARAEFFLKAGSEYVLLSLSSTKSNVFCDAESRWTLSLLYLLSSVFAHLLHYLNRSASLSQGVLHFRPSFDSNLALYSGSMTLFNGEPLSLPAEFFSFQTRVSPLPLVDMVIICTNPWKWSSRRADVFRAFLATSERTTWKAKLIFVMGGDGQPENLDEDDEIIFSHEDVKWVAAPGCPDFDVGLWDGWPWPVANSSTTCKVLEGAAIASETYSFRYLARIGDDSYLRWDYFLDFWAPRLPTSAMMMGTYTYDNDVKPHLQKQLGGGHFLTYATGAGYIMTPDIAEYLRAGYRASPRFFTSGPEDAALAYLMYPLNVHNERSDQFHDVTYRQWGTKVCTAESILVHYVTKTMWESIDEDGVMAC